MTAQEHEAKASGSTAACLPLASVGLWVRSLARMPEPGQLIVKRWDHNRSVWAGFYHGSAKEGSFDEWAALESRAPSGDAPGLTEECKRLADKALNARAAVVATNVHHRTTEMSKRCDDTRADLLAAIDKLAALQPAASNSIHQEHLAASSLRDSAACLAAAFQPIESAPKDGSYILVRHYGGAWIAHWHPVAVSGYRFDQPWRSVMLNHDHIAPAARHLPPTHWMPLPPPEEQKRSGAAKTQLPNEQHESSTQGEPKP